MFTTSAAVAETAGASAAPAGEAVPLADVPRAIVTRNGQLQFRSIAGDDDAESDAGDLRASA